MTGKIVANAPIQEQLEQFPHEVNAPPMPRGLAPVGPFAPLNLENVVARPRVGDQTAGFAGGGEIPKIVGQIPENP